MGYVAGSDLTLGTTVAGYRIEELIGRGGMGAVYRALVPLAERAVFVGVQGNRLHYTQLGQVFRH
jgi:hypothetical protein